MMHGPSAHVQLALPLFSHAGWGGRRAGAGRRRAPGTCPSVPHRARPSHKASHPLHLTLRVRSGLPSLRGIEVFPAVHAALARAQRAGFRVNAFSVQDDHVHLIVEAAGPVDLASGARGLQIRLARAINRATARRGRAMGDRYHVRALRTPREVRFCLVYVLHNLAKHQPTAATVRDPCSSAGSFDGYRDAAQGETDAAARPPRTWLLRVGWRRHGLLDPHERPARLGR